MTNVTGPGGELRATIHVKRKATGKVETFHLVGRTTPEQHAKIVEALMGGRLADAQAAGLKIDELRGPVIDHGSSGDLAGPGAQVNKEENDNDGRP